MVLSKRDSPPVRMPQYQDRFVTAISVGDHTGLLPLLADLKLLRMFQGSESYPSLWFRTQIRYREHISYIHTFECVKC